MNSTYNHKTFNTFGPRQSQRAAIPTIIAQILQEKVIKLGNLRSSRDFTLVEDTVNGFIKTIKNKKCIGEVINLGTGSHFTIKETVKMISKILDKKIKVTLDKKRIRPKKVRLIGFLKNLKAKKSLDGNQNTQEKKVFIVP